MNKTQHFSFLLRQLKLFFRVELFFLLLMSLVRIYLFVNYAKGSKYSLSELAYAFWIGFRLDVSALAYTFILPVLMLFLLWIFRLRFLNSLVNHFFKLYFFVIFLILSVLIITDIGYFSFFGDHMTLMVFGIFDDDTKALFEIARKNYNLWLYGVMGLIYTAAGYYIISKAIKNKAEIKEKNWNFFKQGGFFLALFVIVFLAVRGSVGLFPLAVYIPDVSSDPVINKLPQNAVHAMIKAEDQYEKSKSGNYDLIKMSGYKGKIAQAFKIYTGKNDINEKNLLSNIIYKTKKDTILEKNPPNVVLDVVESFGMPILAYQSEEFDIMRSLKKNFYKDVLFTNFISASNGTIEDLEPLMLNITARPKSTPFGQSRYLNTSFFQASARVYQKAGYETTFVYGGDLSWRNVGAFFSRQGFDHVYGKAAIIEKLQLDEAKVSHDWGVYDKYLHEYVLQKLKEAKKPQLIVVMTTNNHPPYKLDPAYDSKKLHFSDELKKHLVGDLALDHQRFQDYQYALDMVGHFLDEVKNSSLKDNTVVAITGDNNTVEGIMHYDDYYTQTKRIPFYIYLPPALRYKIEGIDMKTAGSDKDIFPTLYNLTLSDASYTAIGTNLLDKNKLHCGFNDEGVIVANDGGFKAGHPNTKLQKECDRYYDATLAVTEYLIKSQK
ncbi:sulfatase-like hydrolase/transferase [Sulfurimonas sp. HSL-1716]|uniref:LTA synthase family protein n=1 Tax=Hydrocurvibacter sulfurireducens TaxID=3131937 RepID=UPI0031F9C358